MYLALPEHDVLKKALLPTDGAGCFSGKLFCLGVPLVFAQHGVQLLDHLTGESGGNKSQLDGRFAVSKRGAREVAVAGRGTRDITDASSLVHNFADSASAGTLTVEFILERGNEAKVKKAALPGLSYIAHRHYEYDLEGKVKTLVLRKQHGVGTGRVYTAAAVAKMWDGAVQGPTGVRTAPSTSAAAVDPTTFKPPSPRLPMVPGAVSKEASTRKRKEDRLVRGTKRRRNLVEQKEEVLLKKKARRGHPCVEPHCTRIFTSAKLLANHVSAGKHTSGKNPFRRSKAAASATRFQSTRDMVAAAVVRGATAAGVGGARGGGVGVERGVVPSSGGASGAGGSDETVGGPRGGEVETWKGVGYNAAPRGFRPESVSTDGLCQLRTVAGKTRRRSDLFTSKDESVIIELLTLLGELRTLLDEALATDPEGGTAQHLAAYLVTQDMTWEQYAAQFDHLRLDQEIFPMLDGAFLAIWAKAAKTTVVLHQPGQPPLTLESGVDAGEAIHVAFSALHYWSLVEVGVDGGDEADNGGERGGGGASEGDAEDPHWQASSGWAHTPKRSKGRRYTAGQLDFLRACYQRGVVNKKDKLSAEATEKLMRIHGTAEGTERFPSDPYWATASGPTFRWAELLEKWVIKPWFGQQKAAFEKKIMTQRRNALLSLTVKEALESDDEDDE
jgi:hypothetical protein